MAQITNRNETLDVFRLIAATVVVTYHCLPSTITGTEVLSIGVLSVDFFFVLSGFVLAPTLDRYFCTRDFVTWCSWRLKRFYVPLAPVFVFMAIGWSISEGASLNLVVVVQWLERLLLLQVFDESLRSYNSPLWSLSAEIVVNLVFALCLSFLSKRSTGFGLLCIGVLLWLYGLLTHGSTIAGPLALGRAFLGFAIGLLIHEYSSKFKAIGSSHVIIFSVVVCYFQNIYRFELLLFVDFLAAMIVLKGFEHNPLRGFWRKDFGNISYELYVWHMPVISASLALSARVGVHFDNSSARLVALPFVILSSYFAGVGWRRLISRARLHRVTKDF